MGAENLFTLDEIKVLLLIKLLDEYEHPDYLEDTLADKINRFDHSSADMDIEVFEAGLDKMEETGLLVWDNIEDAYELTEKGK